MIRLRRLEFFNNAVILMILLLTVVLCECKRNFDSALAFLILKKVVFE